MRARTSGLTPDAVDGALADGSLVIAWLFRGTLHLVRAEDHGWLLGLTARAGMVGSRRRLAEEGVSEAQAETALQVIDAELAGGAARSREELAERLASAGVPVEGQALPHCIRLAALHGTAVLGPVGPAGKLLVRRPAAPASPAGSGRGGAVVELARRYLAGHGPAAAADLASWSGLPLGDARAGLRNLGAEAVERPDGLVDLAGRDAPAAAGPRLLPAFDPYLLGWTDRSFAVPAELRKRVYPGGGILRAVATVDGAVVGTWSLRRATVTLDVADPAHVDALQAEIADVQRFDAAVTSAPS